MTRYPGSVEAFCALLRERCDEKAYHDKEKTWHQMSPHERKYHLQGELIELYGALAIREGVLDELLDVGVCLVMEAEAQGFLDEQKELEAKPEASREEEGEKPSV